MGLFPSDDPGYAATYAQEAAMVDAAELIAEALEDAKISQADLARRLGVSRAEITARLRGERNITVRKLAETLHALGARLELRIAEGAGELAPTATTSRWATPDVAEDHVGDHSVSRLNDRWALNGVSH